jgi:hypothetical protein
MAELYFDSPCPKLRFDFPTPVFADNLSSIGDNRKNGDEK